MAKNLLLDGEIYLYGNVGDPYGFGEGFTPEQVAEALVEHGPGDVTARINSGGGVAFDGMAIYSLLLAHSGKVTIKIDGVAASAASLIAMAGSEIEMRVGTMMMIHDPSGATFGPAAAHEKSAKTLHKLADNYAAVYAAKTGLGVDEVRNLMLATTWLAADEAVAKKFATKKLDADAHAMAPFDYAMYANAPAHLLPLRPLRPASDARARMRMRQASI